MPAGIELGTLDAPEVTLVLDGSNNLTIQDTDGNTIVRFNQDQTADFFGNLLPDTDSSHDLGANATRWANVYADAVTTAAATIGGGDTIQQVEFGQASLSGPAAASDDGWDTSETSTTAVSFSTTFSSAPRVFLSMEGAFTRLRAIADSVTTSGFDVELFNYGTTNRSGNTIDVNWVAIGP